MAVVNGYATLQALKDRLAITDATNDAALEAVLEAASRQIDGITSRVFYQQTAATRTYTPTEYWVLDIDDLVSVTTLKTDEDGDRTYETTWATTDYDLGPENAAAYGKPYTRITLTPNGVYTFPRHAKSVQVVGTFGWPSIPDAINEATLLASIRLYQRRNAPFGIASALDVGQVLRIPKDDDVAALIQPYRRIGLVAL